jgi:hypothetical protein
LLKVPKYNTTTEKIGNYIRRYYYQLVKYEKIYFKECSICFCNNVSAPGALPQK